ncbi:Arm DNA-binding domain-containing protein [Domibacillus robiginosus]|uniref:Arm DNA-binding domain-containing protein n=1 Tax=Domibacillus robiginosus TaxID=1071054 RepID=UPI00067AA60B|nr:Arm DNA-binding domain-containing protein [Domibacillus robiginosus]
MASFSKYQTKQGEKGLFKLDISKDSATGKRKTKTRRGFNKKKDAEAAAIELPALLRDNTYDNRNTLWTGIMRSGYSITRTAGA